MLSYWSSTQPHNLVPNIDGINASIAGFSLSESDAFGRSYQSVDTTGVVFGRTCVNLGSERIASPDDQKLSNTQSRCRKRNP